MQTVHNDKLFGQLNDLYYSRLAEGSWTLVVGANVRTFAVIGGHKVDQDLDGITDNAFRVKGYDTSVSLNYNFSQRIAFTGAGHWGRRRQDATAGSTLGAYPGWSASIGHAAIILDEDYRDTEAYRQYGFIPSIVFGASMEAEWCRQRLRCENDRTSQVVGTLFVDFKLARTTQFRLGLPVKRIRLVGTESQTDLGVAVQLGLQLSKRS